MKIYMVIGLSLFLGACTHFTQSPPTPGQREVANQAPADTQIVGEGTNLIVGNMDYPFFMDVKPGEVLSQKIITVDRNYLHCEAQHVFRGTDQHTRIKVREHKDIYIFKSKDIQKRSFPVNINGKKAEANQYAISYIFRETKTVAGEPTKEISVYCLTQVIPDYDFAEIAAGELDNLFINFNVRVRSVLQDVDHRDTMYEAGYGMPINK